MSLEEIDLTLGSLFASDAKPHLKLRNEWSYFREHGVKDQRNEILDIELSSLFPEIRRLDSDAALETGRIDYDEAFYRIFGRYSKGYWHGYMGDGSQCDCCGAELNLLNRAPYCLCLKCNDTEDKPAI